MTSSDGALTAKWMTLPYHRSWLLDQANDLFEFYEPHSVDPHGGFFYLDDRGQPIIRTAAGEAPARQLHTTARLVYCFAIARLMGRPGAESIIDHGMDFLWNGHRDAVYGGYVWSVGRDGRGDDRKQAYGHAFVLLAASSAKLVGHPNADRLLADVREVLLERFWEPEFGAAAEEFERDWKPIGPYRGQNSNMHLSEACMAAFEATGDRAWLKKAESIARLIIGKHAAALGGRVAEHFDEKWQPDRGYDGGDIFRPYGMTPGHWLEWTRLLLQLWELGGRRLDWVPDAARQLFANAVTEGWNAPRGGFHYTLDWASRPHLGTRLWWPAAEGIGAAAFLNVIDGAPEYEKWYRRIWDFVVAHLIDRQNGGWRTEPMAPEPGSRGLFEGKPDLYHALQACLIPLLPTSGTITHGLTTGGLGQSKT
jgi:sulfoquinovose isomerase